MRFGSGPFNTDPNDMMNSPIINTFPAPTLIFNNGYWDMSAFPENRYNDTVSLKGSYFATWNGTHEVDFGIDYYKGGLQARNAQSVTSWTFYTRNFSILERDITVDGEPVKIPADHGIPYFAINWRGVYAKAGQETYGFYINDKWKLDQHWSFQIGLRYDMYEAFASDVTDRMASASGISPRLGITYDILGDQTYIVKASYCRYNGPVLEGITGAISNAGNPSSWQYAATWRYYMSWATAMNSPELYMTREQLTNPENYGDPIKGGPSYVEDPLFNISVNNSMKAPTTDEFQLGFAYTFNFADYGQGYAGLTLVRKNWKNIIGSKMGTKGIAWAGEPWDWTENDDNPNLVQYPAWNVYYDNLSRARRNYQSMEFEFDYIYKKWHLTGNITWS
jgi:hypothetical protein